jgi:hypothetical protein
MKLINSFWLGQTTGETLATFGAARLVKKLDGKIELIGGTADDHAAAREWCSLFAPDVVFTSSSRRNPATAFAA